jgi:hypothetical protein
MENGSVQGLLPALSVQALGNAEELPAGCQEELPHLFPTDAGNLSQKVPGAETVVWWRQQEA